MELLEGAAAVGSLTPTAGAQFATGEPVCRGEQFRGVWIKVTIQRD
jgi:hypothetical protein